MRRLILFRHARAPSRRPGIGDLDRPLDSEGRRDAAAAGRWLAEKGFVADMVLVSPSVRTQETWACAASTMAKSRVQVEASLYDATPEEIWAAIESEAATSDTIIVVAHNPGLQELAVDLLASGPSSSQEADLVAAGFPTATVAVLDMQDPAGPRLMGLYNPRQTPPPFVESWDERDGEAP